jgi:hypothetical protein
VGSGSYNTAWDISAAPDGGVFFASSVFAALPGETYGGASDAVVGKVSAAGTLSWAHQLGSSGDESPVSMTATPDGAVLVVGTAGGQLPGMPSTEIQGDWAVRYEANGTRTWLQQYAPSSKVSLTAGSSTIHSLSVDASGNLVIITTKGIVKLDSSQGTVLSSYIVSTVAPPHTYFSVQSQQVNPTSLGGSTVYLWNASTSSDVNTTNYGLEELSLRGAMSLFRQFEPARTAVIDPVENVIWTGNISSTGAVLATSDAIYLTGDYQNSYLNGSIAPPTTNNLFVGKYSLAGDRVWFQELSPPSTSSYLTFTLCGIILDPSGNLVLETNAPTGYLFKLRATDGTVM